MRKGDRYSLFNEYGKTVAIKEGTHDHDLWLICNGLPVASMHIKATKPIFKQLLKRIKERRRK